MARIFSWSIKNNEGTVVGYSYLATEQPTEGYTIKDDKITDEVLLKSMANIVAEYTAQEYKTYFNQMVSSVKTRWNNVSFREWSYYYDVGSSLIMLTGNQGEKGDQGKPGDQGEPGETGAAGTGRNIQCFRSTPKTFEGKQITEINPPIGGKFYPDTWEIEYPYSKNEPFDGGNDVQWGDSNEFGEDTIVWLSNAYFDNNGNIVVKENGESWSKPIRITGADGDNGADGETIEFIYKQAKTREQADMPNNPNGELGTSPTNTALHEFDKIEKGFVPLGWTDHPQGISREMKAEYMCSHTKNGNMWGEWVGPVLWSSWGEDGMDGDGIEYIYAVTSEYGADNIVGSLPKSTNPLLKDHWQDNEIWDYIKESNLESEFAPWTDDPSDVDQEHPYEWVAMRYRNWNTDEEHSVWGEFSKPVLWAHWGKNGEKGDDGTSLNLKRGYETLGQLLQAMKKGETEFPPKMGDAYAIGTDVDSLHLFVWMGLDESITATTGIQKYDPINGNYDYTNDNEYFLNFYYSVSGTPYWFSDCGHFYGESGMSAYVHIKYAKDCEANDGDGRLAIINNGDQQYQKWIKFTSGNGETPGPYIATYTDNMFDDISDLGFYCGDDWNGETGRTSLWTKWRGDDGQSYGQEQIFTRTMIPTPPTAKQVTSDDHGYIKGEYILDISYPDDFYSTVDYVPDGWTDVPQGIENGTYNFEWVSVRRLLEDGTWSYFSKPALYNQAIDTQLYQVEYTTYTGTGNTIVQELTKDNANFRNFESEEAWREAYSQFGPWSDESSSATTWMAQCYGRHPNSNTAVTDWDNWMVIKCKGDDGYTVFTSFAFTSLKDGYDISNCTLKGGSFANPEPEQTLSGTSVLQDIKWYDAPPQDGNIIWMTSAVFSNENGSTTITEWAKPKRLADTADLEIIYSSNQDPEQIPTGFTKETQQLEEEWFKKANAVGWYDDADQCPSGVIWMATTQMKNGVWGEWNVMKVKGEKGDSGDLKFLENIFTEVDNEPDKALLRGFVGVVENGTQENVVAFINGHDSIADSTHGTLMMAAGVDSVEDANNAKFRVYEDGSVYAEDAYIKGEIEANEGSIGGIHIGSDGISTDGFSIGSDGFITASNISINNENVIINDDNIIFLNGGNPVLSVGNKTYSSAADFLATEGTPISEIGGYVALEEQDFRNVGSPTIYGWTSGFTGTTDVTENVICDSNQRIEFDFNWNLRIQPYDMMGTPISGYNISDVMVLQFYYGSYMIKLVQFEGQTSEYSNGAVASNTETGVVVFNNMNAPFKMSYTLMVTITRGIGGAAPIDHITISLSLNNYHINGTIIDKATEIFSNGFGLKSDINNYFFVARNDSTGLLTLDVKSGGKGLYLHDGKLVIDATTASSRSTRDVEENDINLESDKTEPITESGQTESVSASTTVKKTTTKRKKSPSGTS